jgi:hypothetical protein
MVKTKASFKTPAKAAGKFVASTARKTNSAEKARAASKAIDSSFEDAPSLTTPPEFPTLWTEVLDELIPQFVKNRFSPQESWKNKPFTKEDVNFFSQGLIELSDFFTLDRDGAKLPNYFTTARFRSSYFLYFFALQGAKFLTLFYKYPKAVEAAITHAKKTGTMRIVDVGSGPGTASIAFLIFVLEIYKKSKKLPFDIELHWIDRNPTVIKDGEAFLNEILSALSDFEGSIHLKSEVRDWWKHPADFQYESSIVLFGNVLNESTQDSRVYLQGLAPFLKDPKGAGILIVEPAFKSASQRVSQIRDEIMPHPIWGPCLHTQKCPLAEGRDWCHFSVPAKLPGEFFRKFSIKLGGVRDWLKFSFVWVASNDSTKEATVDPKLNLVRVVSDPLKTPQGLKNQVCKPVQIGWFDKKGLQRGDVIRYSDERNDQIFQPRFQANRNRKSIRK